MSNIPYYQLKPQGKFIKKTKPPTVVSAYYCFKSKYPSEKYTTWLKLFLENVPCHLVFFCDPTLVDFVAECRKNYIAETRIVPLPQSDWIANTKADWVQQLSRDPEAGLHNPDLYKVWYEKKEFVKRAIALDPWTHDDFVWVDAGIVRNVHTANLIKHFPDANRIPIDRIMLLNVEPFVKGDNKIFTYSTGNITGEFHLWKTRIGGGIIAAHKNMWTIWDSLYNTTFETYKAANRFVGKDQNIMATIVLEHKDKISLVNPSKITTEPWFYMLYYLGLNDTQLQYLTNNIGCRPLQHEELYNKLMTL
jgi:hypothetical protein